MASCKPRKAGQNFLHGALVLTVSMILVKLIGAMFKLPLTWLITEEGLGYFNTAYHFYSPIHSLATAGFPIAIARIVAGYTACGRYRDARAVRKAAFPIFVVTGGLGVAVMVFSGPFYARAIGNGGAVPALLCLAPAVLFSCLAGVYRGYYEGLRNMYPTALSEVIEALLKLIIGLGAAYAVFRFGMGEYAANGTVWGQEMISEAFAKSVLLPYTAAAAAFGVTGGSLISFLYLSVYHRCRGDGVPENALCCAPLPEKRGKLTSRLIKTALPIGAGALAVNVAALVDTTFLQTQLGRILAMKPQPLLEMYAGMIPDLAVKLETGTLPNFLFGCYSQALALFMLVPGITQAFATSALPSVTAAFVSENRCRLQSSIAAVLRMTALVCIPAGLGLSVLANPVCRAVFGDKTSTPIAARTLAVLGVAAVLASLCTPLFSMLQAVGREDLPVKLLCIGLGLKVGLNVALTGIAQVNILGAGIGTLVCYAFIAVAACRALCKAAGISLPYHRIFTKPTIAALLCCVAAHTSCFWLQRYLPDGVATGSSVLLGAVVYVIVLLCIQGLCKEDVEMLPKGKKIAKILEKHRFI